VDPATEGDDVIMGTYFEDHINAKGGNDTVSTFESNDTIDGEGGDDFLDGGAGADTLIGGTGNDTFVVDNTGDVVIENANEGIDTVQSSISFTLGDDIENLILIGDESIDGTGNGLDNTLAGNNGYNNLAGGAGNDTYVFDLGGGLDTITDTSGSDTILFGQGIALEDLSFTVDASGAHVRILDSEGYQTGDGLDISFGPDATFSVETMQFADGQLLSLPRLSTSCTGRTTSMTYGPATRWMWSTPRMEAI
jgi:Ca2+-binding RTX toxin-like protein